MDLIIGQHMKVLVSIDDMQFGFMSGKGTTDAVQIVSTTSAPLRWCPDFMLFVANPDFTPAGWLALLLIKADCYCTHSRCSANCIISTICSAVCIYQIQHKLCLPLWMCGEMSFEETRCE